MTEETETTKVHENVEMEFRGRLTGLEVWRGQVDSALGLIGTALIALALAGLALSVLLRKRQS